MLMPKSLVIAPRCMLLRFAFGMSREPVHVNLNVLYQLGRIASRVTMNRLIESARPLNESGRNQTMKHRSLSLLFAALFITAALSAQTVHWTATNHSPNPTDDTKPNSSAVPDAYALSGHFDRIVVIRIKNGADLLKGMMKVVQEQKIQNGVILAGIGSLRGYEVHQISNRNLPTQDTFEKDPMQPADLVSMNGYIIDGRIHAHVTLGTPDHVIAGHLEENTEVYTYAMVTVGVMSDTNLARIDDKSYR